MGPGHPRHPLLRPLIPALAGGLLLGCGSPGSLLQRPGPDATIRLLLQRAGVAPTQLDCRMLGNTRNAECSLRLSAADSTALIRSLRLEAIPMDPASSSGLAALVRFIGPGCGDDPTSPAELHGLAGRPASLRLGASAFEYLVLRVEPSSRRACLQVSYSYG